MVVSQAWGSDDNNQLIIAYSTDIFKLYYCNSKTTFKHANVSLL